MHKFDKAVPVIGLLLLCFIGGGISAHYKWGPGKIMSEWFDGKEKKRGGRGLR
jgi:hypothetical protein